MGMKELQKYFFKRLNLHEFNVEFDKINIKYIMKMCFLILKVG